MKLSKIKLISYVGMLSLLASLVVGLLGFANYTEDINRVKTQLLNKHVENNIILSMKYLINTYGTLTSGEGTLLDRFGKSIAGRSELVDSIWQDLGDKSTIFVKENNDFKRISTNIMNDNTRALGTYLGSTHNAYATVMKGELYIGEVTILGETYHAAYDPIKDRNNNVIGLLFVGVPTKTLDDVIAGHDSKMNTLNLLIIILRSISLGSLVALVSISGGTKRTVPSKDRAGA